MRAIMKPLVAQAPFIGAVTVFFLNRPVQIYSCYSTNIHFTFAVFCTLHWFITVAVWTAVVAAAAALNNNTEVQCVSF